MLDPRRGYDLIGDVHGCAKALERLLERLGYRSEAGVWRHPRRMALFLGDILDRGPRIREALEIVRLMCEAGSAQCLMGNHEFHALAWTTKALPGSTQPFVREHNLRQFKMIEQTLKQFEAYPQDWQDTLAWCQSLPLLIDAGRFRLVHACWDKPLVEQFRAAYPDGVIDPDFVQQSSVAGTLARRASQRLLRGLSLPLPSGQALASSDGYVREWFRTRFWQADQEPDTYGDVVFQPDALPEQVALLRLSPSQKHELMLYGPDEPLLFVGHYWLSGVPAPLRPNLACLDYSAVKYGKLVAYRLDDEAQIDPRKFVWVDVERPERRP